MRRLTAAAAVLAVLLLPITAAAHGGGIPWIYVEDEQIWPGEQFHVLILDVSPFVTVRLEAETGATRVALGEVETGAQGHGETDVALPSDFPLGHAQLHGIGDDGSEVSTLIRVGDVPDIEAPGGPQQPTAPPAVASPLADPSVWTLGALVVGGLLALGWLALRGRRAAAPAVAARARPERPRTRRQRRKARSR